MNEDINIKIKSLMDKNEVCLFMKGTPEVPQCGFSLAVSNVLKHLNVKFSGVNVLEDPKIREGIKIYSDWPTIPQLYIKGEFVGGCDIVKEMFEKGDLQKKLKEKISLIKKINYLNRLLVFLLKYFLINLKKEIFLKSSSLILLSILYSILSSQANSITKLSRNIFSNILAIDTVMNGSSS